MLTGSVSGNGRKEVNNGGEKKKVGGWTCDGMKEAEGHGTDTGDGRVQRGCLVETRCRRLKDSKVAQGTKGNTNTIPQNVC